MIFQTPYRYRVLFILILLIILGSITAILLLDWYKEGILAVLGGGAFSLWQYLSFFGNIYLLYEVHSDRLVLVSIMRWFNYSIPLSSIQSITIAVRLWHPAVQLDIMEKKQKKLVLIPIQPWEFLSYLKILIPGLPVLFEEEAKKKFPMEFTIYGTGVVQTEESIRWQGIFAPHRDKTGKEESGEK